jgi:hypothetical protein
MKSLLNIVLCVFILGFNQNVAAETEVEIEWQNPEKYRDVRSANESRKRFRESTFKRLDEYINELAEVLPKDNKLILQVSDLDLAGRVWPASFVGLGLSGSEVRVIKQIDIPRMHFSYQLYSASGEVVKQAEVKLKDMSFMDRSNHFFKNEPLRYEKNMLRDWFKKEFKSQIVALDVEADD